MGTPPQPSKGEAPPRPSPVGRGTRGETGTYRDASLKSLSVTARRDACHASGTKATVNYTLFKNKDNKMKLSFNKNNLPWMLIVLGSLATFYGYNLLFHVVSNV